MDDIVALAKGGDRDAFAELYRRYRPLVRGVLLARLSEADADDVTQEVFVTAHKKLAQLKDHRAVGAWLCTIARTRAIDLHRSRKPSEPLADTHVDTSKASAADVVEAKRVLAVIRELPEAYRESLVLRLVEGLTGPEIAAQTGMTEGSVRVNLHRGIAMLKERLGA